ncbi:MAG: hypothetical protein Q9214_003421 [Letrouitia sp. 1 TL-2023]
MASHPAQGTKRDFEEMTLANKANEEETSLETVVADKALSDRCGKRLKSTVFTIFVGPDKENFIVHQSALNASPVLSRLCSESSITNRLDLPDDDPSQFGLLLEFLYSKDFDSLNDDSSDSRDNAQGTRSAALEELCQIYRIGEKYQLPNLQKCAVDKLDKMTDTKRDPMSFLQAAKELYKTLADSDSIFTPFFLKKAEKLLRQAEIPASVRQLIQEALAFGGEFANDIFKAQRNAFLESQRANQEKAKELKSFQTANKSWQDLHTETQNRLEQIKDNHDYNHDDCDYCTKTDI